MTHLIGPLFSPFHHLGRRFWIRFLIACVLVLGIESWVERSLEDGHSEVAESVFSFSRLYRAVVAAPREPISRFTVVVEIDPDRDEAAVGLTELCKQRLMLAHLLGRVAAAHPHVIVIDKFFSPARCGPDINGTLRRVIEYADESTRVVTGLRASREERYLEPSLDLGVPSDRQALVNVDPDTRKMPLKWELFPTKEAQNTRWYETLALVAARVRDGEDSLASHPRLRELARNAIHPYVSFLDVEQFPCFAAGQLLGTASAPCAGKAMTDTYAMNGQVVLIGEINKDLDQHNTVVGIIPGVYLQANFVEALLDDRYYRPVPWLDYLLGFVFIAGIDLILLIHHESLGKALALITLLFLAVFFILFLVIVHGKWYVNPLPVGTTAILIKVLHGIYSKVEEHPAHPKHLAHPAKAAGLADARKRH